MSRIGVQMIHKCGHAGYHVVEQMNDARSVYAKMEEKPCPMCAGREFPDSYTVRYDGSQPNFTKEEPKATNIRQQVREAVSRATRRRRVVVRRVR